MSSLAFKDHYKALGLLPASDKESVRKAYRELVSKHYASIGNGDKAMDHTLEDILEAYTVLIDDSKRREYDVSYELYRKKNHVNPDNEIFTNGPQKGSIEPLIDLDEIERKKLNSEIEKLYRKTTTAGYFRRVSNKRLWSKEARELYKRYNKYFPGMINEKLDYILSLRFLTLKSGIILSAFMIIIFIVIRISSYSSIKTVQTKTHSDSDKDGVEEDLDMEPYTPWLKSTSKYLLSEYVDSLGKIDRKKIQKLLYEEPDFVDSLDIACLKKAGGYSDVFTYNGKKYRFTDGSFVQIGYGAIDDLSLLNNILMAYGIQDSLQEFQWKIFFRQFRRAYSDKDIAKFTTLTSEDFFSGECFCNCYGWTIYQWAENLFKVDGTENYEFFGNYLDKRVNTLKKEGSLGEDMKVLGGKDLCRPRFIFYKNSGWKFVGFRTSC